MSQPQTVKILKGNNLFKILLVLIFLIITIPLLIYIVTKNRNHALFENVKSAVQIEYDKIQIPNLVSEDKHIFFSTCDYDYKVESTRCSITYTKYYVTDEDVVEKFIRNDNYLTSLGWKYWMGPPDSSDQITRMLKSGFPPGKNYLKEEQYPLSLSMYFYGDKDRELSNIKVIELLNKYSKENKSVYSISVSSDIIKK